MEKLILLAGSNFKKGHDRLVRKGAISKLICRIIKHLG
jgi:hypothetical protein